MAAKAPRRRPGELSLWVARSRLKNVPTWPSARDSGDYPRYRDGMMAHHGSAAPQPVRMSADGWEVL